MFQSRPVIVSAALALLLGLLAVGPQVVAAAQDDEEVTLRVWDQFTGPESSVVDSIYAGFSEANPNVTIERESFSTDQMRDTINTALSSGTGPDVILYDPGPGYAGARRCS
jgi:ABC-type glycerol-3-phosphate transport system substrate-binding protein